MVTVELTDAVPTTAGLVAGRVDDGIGIFRGIPYGAPTGGANRFQPPQPPPTWENVRECTRHGLACPQPSMSVDLLLDTVGTGREGEDCLVLNVYTPGADGRARPVMVWYHGGGFTIGSGSAPAFDGRRLARRGDVVVVTVNHRLGHLGHLYLADLADGYDDSGNAGTLDMVASLQWVRDNIAAFGGDPGNVTIFGESGGGAKVCTLLASPAAEGLFHRAVVQSGPMLRGIDPGGATEIAREMVDVLGGGRVDALADVSVEQFVAAQSKVLGGPLGGRGSIGPVVDGRTLLRHPFDPDPAPTARRVPVMIGTTKDEMTMFAMGVDPASIDRARVVAGARTYFGDHAEEVVSLYERTRPTASPFELDIAIGTDAMRVGSIRIAERLARAGGAPAYMYRFDYESSLHDGRLKATHAIEIPFVFDTIERAGQMALHGNRPDAQALADVVSETWLAFARTGDPNHSGLPSWPVYDEHRRATMVFDSESRVVDDPDGEERRAWDQSLFTGI